MSEGSPGLKGGVLNFWQREQIEVHYPLKQAPLTSLCRASDTLQP